MSYPRRQFIRHFAVLGGMAGAAVLMPGTVLAAVWNQQAFVAKGLDAALAAIDAAAPTASADIAIDAPDVASNGSMVPVTITSSIPGTESIAILVEHNPVPLIAEFSFLDGADPFVSTRIKMGKTSNIWAVARVDGKVFSASREVKVTLGGCGG